MENAEAFIRDHRTESVPALALMLADRPREEAEYILRQIEGWQKLNANVGCRAATSLSAPPFVGAMLRRVGRTL